MVQLVRHPQTKGRETDRLHLNHRATSRLYSPRSVWHSPVVLAQETPRSNQQFLVSSIVHLGAPGRCDEWHLDFDNAFCHIALEFGA